MLNVIAFLTGSNPHWLRDEPWHERASKANQALVLTCVGIFFALGMTSFFIQFLRWYAAIPVAVFLGVFLLLIDRWFAESDLPSVETSEFRAKIIHGVLRRALRSRS